MAISVSSPFFQYTCTKPVVYKYIDISHGHTHTNTILWEKWKYCTSSFFLVIYQQFRQGNAIQIHIMYKIEMLIPIYGFG